MKTISVVVFSSLVILMLNAADVSMAQDATAGISNGSLLAKISLLISGGEKSSERLPQSPAQLPPLRSTVPLERLAQSCPSGYPVNCGEFCCESGYSCETNCRCKTGKGLCSSGCCPADKPHTCPESNHCYRTVQDAVDGDCTWQSVEVCGVAR